MAGQVQGAVVGAAVAAGGHPGPLHEQVVEQAGGADAEPARVQPVLPRRLVDQHQVPDGVLGGADAAGRLDADLAAVRLAEVPHRLQHDQRHRQRGGRGDLAGGCLDEVGAGEHGQPRGAAHVVQRDKLAGLQDHLQARPAGLPGCSGGVARLPDRGDLVVDGLVGPGQEGAAVDHHVDLVRARRDRRLHVGELDVQAGTAAGERGGDAGHAHAAALQLGRGDVHEVRVHADGGDLRRGRVGRVGAPGLGAQRPHLARGVLALQRGQVDHRDGGVERPALGRGLDRPAGQRGRPRLRPHPVHPGQAVQGAPQVDPDISGRGHRRLPPVATIVAHRRGRAPGPGRGRRLNVFSGTSGSLRNSGCLSSGCLKVGGRSWRRTEKDEAARSGGSQGAIPMSDSYDPGSPDRAREDGTRGEQSYQDQQGYGSGYGYRPQGYLGGPGFAGGGYPAPPPPPRRRRRRGLAITGAAALVAGAAAGALIGSLHPSAAGTATATSKTALTASQIASRVDPALADVVSADGYQGATSEGTGIVLTASGEVLTNNHVIEGATSIQVTDIGNGTTYRATVVGYDASHDVAVLQLHGATGTVTALDQSITASDELSGVSEQLAGLIEDNASIQPGDSGGPLVNAYGQVIGMNTAASSGYQFQSAAAEQAYAIPINQAVSIARQIEAGAASADVHVGATAFLGVQIRGPGAGNGLGGSGGVSVAGVVPGSPAAGAGLTAGDTITAVAGRPVSSPEDVAHALVRYHPGDSVAVSWLDGYGQSHTATIPLATGPAA